MKKVTLPIWMKELAHEYASLECELADNNYSGRKKNNPKKNKLNAKKKKELYQQSFYEYCKEAYEHSLSPSGNLRNNPTTPVVSNDSIEKLNIADKIINMGKTKEIRARLKHADSSKNEKELTYLYSQYKGALLSMASIVMKIKLGYTIKGENSAYAYSSDDEMVDVLDADKVRYYRLGVLTSLINVVDNIFNMNTTDLENILDENLPMNLPKYKETNDKNVYSKAMKDPIKRQEYVTTIYSKISTYIRNKYIS
jgi:hypothetical protein